MIGCHQLLVLNFYPFLQKYMQPHQAEVPTILASLVQVGPLTLHHHGMESSSRMQ